MGPEYRASRLIAPLALVFVLPLGVSDAVRLPSVSRIAPSGPLFLVDDTVTPRSKLTWTRMDGTTQEIELTLPYTDPNQRHTPIRNLEAFIAVGGTRLDKGAGHPLGAILRVGYYKKDASKPLFEDIKANTLVRIELHNVCFNQPPHPLANRVVQHLKYSPTDMLACGIEATATDQYNTSDAGDTMYGKLTPANSRLGGLDGADPTKGSVELKVLDDGSVSMVATIPYALFRHVRDPWLRANPGTFFEPTHFHIEYEVIPEGAPEDPKAVGAR